MSVAFEPGHEKTCLMSYANNKGADQPAQLRSLISAFVVHCLDSIISLDSKAKISRSLLASVVAQAGLCLAGSETPDDTFCRVMAHLYIYTSHCVLVYKFLYINKVIIAQVYQCMCACMHVCVCACMCVLACKRPRVRSPRPAHSFVETCS